MEGRKKNLVSALTPHTPYSIRDTSRASRGVTLIDTLVASALMLVVFIGITAAFQLSLDVVTNNRIRAGAIALMNERMEYLRSLSYTQIGVEGGIPAGNVPQIETVSWNNVDYTRRTSVLYSDDPGDGLGIEDENGIIADYKAIRVEVSWNSRQGERSIQLVGRVSPSGVETDAGGGVLTIIVVNAAAAPVFDAQIDIINTETSPAINIRTYTNSEGMVSFIGAPAASNYQITVSKPNYSSAQTYPETVENPDPNPRHLTVVNDQTTSSSFAVDFVSTKTVETWMQVTPADWSDTFDDDSLISATSSTEVVGGAITLEGGAPYPPLGTVRSVSVAPSLLAGWNSFSWTHTEPAGTEVRYRVYDASGALIPDGVLSGNSTGFTSSPVNISAVSHITYPALRLGAELSTSDENETPSLNSWTVNYDYGPEPFPDLSFWMRGAKTIGNNPTIYKYNETHDSGALASITLSSIEWDTYSLGVASTTGYDLAESCAPQPEILAPGSVQTTQLYVLPHTANTLLVDVRANNGDVLSGASVQLTRTGYDTTLSTSSCGQTFFEDLAAGTYSISVSKTGYQTYNNASIPVLDVSQLPVVLNAQ